MSKHIAIIRCSLRKDNARLGVHSAKLDGKPILELMLDADDADTGYLPLTLDECMELGSAMVGFAIGAKAEEHGGGNVPMIEDMRALIEKHGGKFPELD